MKRLLILPVVALAAVLVAVAAGAGTQTVQVTANGFTPQSATVNAGDTVTWHNADSANHQIVANNGSFASPILHADQSYSHTFDNAGTFRYHDADSTHAGTITVTGPAPALTLSSSTSTLVYGGSATLTGATSAAVASQPVTLSAQAYGKSTQSLDQVNTTSGGDYQFTVSPTIGTTYQTHYKTADSRTVRSASRRASASAAAASSSSRRRRPTCRTRAASCGSSGTPSTGGTASSACSSTAARARSSA